MINGSHIQYLMFSSVFSAVSTAFHVSVLVSFPLVVCGLTPPYPWCQGSCQVQAVLSALLGHGCQSLRLQSFLVVCTSQEEQYLGTHLLTI